MARAIVSRDPHEFLIRVMRFATRNTVCPSAIKSSSLPLQERIRADITREARKPRQ